MSEATITTTILTQNRKLVAKGFQIAELNSREGTIKLKLTKPIDRDVAGLLKKTNKRHFTITTPDFRASFSGYCVSENRQSLELLVDSKVAFRVQPSN